MRILIIGGSGHVSGSLAAAALAAGHEVWTVTRGQRPLLPGVHPLIADRRDDAALRAELETVGTGWDLAVDCICFDVPDIEQDIELLQGRVGHLAMVSTDFVYDPARRRFPQGEMDAHYLNDDSYGARKRRCEERLQASDLRWTIIRPCHIYGAPSRLGCLPLHGRDPELIGRLRRGEPLALVGGGHFLQQPILATDLAQTLLSVGGNDAAAGSIFNAAGPDIIESRRYYEIIGEVLGVPVTVKEVEVAAHLAANPSAASFLCHRIYALDRLRQCGLHVPSTPIEVGLRQHVEGLLQQAK